MQQHFITVLRSVVCESENDSLNTEDNNNSSFQVLMILTQDTSYKRSMMSKVCHLVLEYKETITCTNIREREQFANVRYS